MDGGADEETAVAVSLDWRTAKLQPNEDAMLEFCEKLTVLPSGITEEDIAGLRSQAFTDREILSITLAAAYRNYIARVADSLGVELRKTYSYTSGVLDAFGVSESDVKSTIYGDRITAREIQATRSSQKVASLQVATADHDACWISTEPANGNFAELRADLEQATGPTPLRNLASAFALRPEALRSTLEYGRLLGMGGSGLGRRLEAIIGLVVAITQWVPYMGVHHAQALVSADGSSEDVEALVDDPSGGKLHGNEREVARFCEKVTRSPSAMALSDVEILRRCGFDDRNILTIAASASFESFLCGVTAGLGVKLETAEFAPASLQFFTL